MAALVQSFPQQTSTVAMFQTRPMSASGTFQNGSPGQQHQRSAQTSKNIYNASVGGMTNGNHRVQTSTSPSISHPGSSTPTMGSTANPLGQHPTAPHLRQENRTSSAPSVPFALQTPSDNVSNSLQQHNFGQGLVSASSPQTSGAYKVPISQQSFAKDSVPTALPTWSQVAARIQPAADSNASLPSPATSSSASAAKPSPDRYRRGHLRSRTGGAISTANQMQTTSAAPSGSGMATVAHLYNNPSQANTPPPTLTPSTYRGSQMTQSVVGSTYPTSPRLMSNDDMNLYRQPVTEQAKRYHRRSISSFEAKDMNAHAQDIQSHKVSSQTASQRPLSSHGRSGSTESRSPSPGSSRPSSSSAKREMGVSNATANPIALQATSIAKHEAKVVNIPPRGSSDAHKRLTNPSPLSRPTTMGPASPSSKDSFASLVNQKTIEPQLSSQNTTSNGAPESPAAQHLAALNKKEMKKEGKSSRLRRAFSFGSAAELRKASAENKLDNNSPAERTKLRKEQYRDDEEAEQAAIAQKQEASGLGEGIYSGQGHFFTGSTDNLSISSTASSASVMIRKMGKGMKKSTRSLVGLFRPKSVIGVPAADSLAPEPSLAQVSMVTVEAEREKVNVNVDPHDQAGGGTGFPKLERNSLDAVTSTSEPRISLNERTRDIERPRRSIVGGEKERAEVLAAVKKGILKRNGTDSGNSSPVTRPIDARPSDYNLPHIPQVSDSPGSSTPSTPREGSPHRSGHRRTDSVTIEGEDYFLSIANYASGESKSMPGTPRSIAARNISFSPRIQFHDTWTSGEYDRRGEIATCNRLTPVLAQQIKEELNTFKMEMEVHEHSKVYTHFF